MGLRITSIGLAGAVLLAAVAGSPAARAADCPVPAAPKVVVDRFAGPVAVESQASLEELAKQKRPVRRSAEAVLDKEWDVKPVLGIEVRGDQFCGVPSVVRAAVTYKQRAIVIARELADDACVRPELTGFFTRQMRAEEQALERAAEAAPQDLRRFLATQTMTARATRDEATADVRRLVDDWFAGWRAALDADAAHRRADSTSATERQRLIAACDGRLREIVEAAAPVAPPPVAAATPTPAAASSPAETTAVAPTPTSTPVPAVAGAPVFAGAVQPIATPLVLKLQAFDERPMVVVKTEVHYDDGRPQSARTTTVLRVRVEPRGVDLIRTVRLERIDGVDDPRILGMAVIVTTDAFGKVKSKRVEWPAGAPDKLLPAARALVDAVTAYAADQNDDRTGYPEQGLKTGDAINAASAAIVADDRRHVVRGLATHDGRRVVVVDTVGSPSSGPAGGYALIDAEHGFLVFSSETGSETGQVTGRPVTLETRTVRTMPEPPSAS